MSRKIVCDICGVDITSSRSCSISNFNLYKQGIYAELCFVRNKGFGMEDEDKYDLCEECVEKMFEFCRKGR